MRLGYVVVVGGGDSRPHYRRAIHQFDEALRLNPKSRSAYEKRGDAYMCLGKALATQGKDPRQNYRRAI
ncbi:MAG: hypothetical protein ACYTHM_12280 [Planctomycetota bacterium]|jgi:hypothetical protein